MADLTTLKRKMQQSSGFFALNRGEVSALALARVDIERLRLSAETQVNWLPRTLGPMMTRPGTEYICEVDGSNPCRAVGITYGATDTALFEFTQNKLRVLVNEAPITRPAVTTTVPAFATWTPSASQGATVNLAGVIEISNNCPGLSSAAQTAVSVALAYRGVEHALRIVVDIGPVTVKIGSSGGADDIFKASSLDDGTHSLAFTPNTGTFYIQVSSPSFPIRRISSMTFESAGVFSLPTPYGYSTLADLSIETSGDVTYIAGGGIQQRKISRRGARSFSIETYKSPNGPFPATSGNTSIKITASALTGNVNLNSNLPVFKSTHVGALIRLFHIGDAVIEALATGDSFTKAIRVSGVSKSTDAAGATTATADRSFGLTITGVWVGTLTLQRSLVGPLEGFTSYQTYAANTAVGIADNLDNVVAWYRVGFIGSNYTSGRATINLGYQGGGGAGIARIQTYTSSTQVGVEVISRIYTNNGSEDWRLQEWNADEGFPSALCIHEGRLWQAGSSRVWGSESDAFDSYDIDKTGDAGPINRSIGRGPIQNINWILPLSRLMFGCDSSIITARSNSFDEPLTPSIFTMKDSITIASNTVPAVKVDTSGIFISQSGRKAIEAAFNVQIADFGKTDLTRLNPDIGVPGLTKIAVQNEPDTRLHFVRGDGQVAVLLFDKSDQVEAWWRFQTDGVVEDVVCLPGTLESRVFYIVKRTINGVTKRYWEKHARIDECAGGTLNKMADCFVTYSGAATTTITGLGHLEGKAVVVWGDGKEIGLTSARSDPATYTVASGSITIPTAVSNAIIGLPYDASFKSAKLAYAAQGGTALNKVKRVHELGFMLANTHAQGVKFGPDFDNLDDLPWVEDGAEVSKDAIHSAYDQQTIPFPGGYDTDSRVCLLGQAPRPCTVLGFTIGIDTRG